MYPCMNPTCVCRSIPKPITHETSADWSKQSNANADRFHGIVVIELTQEKRDEQGT